MCSAPLSVLSAGLDELIGAFITIISQKIRWRRIRELGSVSTTLLMFILTHGPPLITVFSQGQPEPLCVLKKVTVRW